MPGVTLTVGLRAELLEILAMAQRASLPVVSASARCFARALERRRHPVKPVTLQLTLWEPPESESRADAGGSPPRTATLGGRKFPEKFPRGDRVPSSEKTKGANP
jgi:hypothetical protein